MAKNQFRFAAILLLLLSASVISRSSIGEESDASDQSYRVWVESDFEQIDPALQYAVDSEYDSDFYFVQEGAVDAPATTPALSRSEAVAARRRRSTYRLPSMFGDFFGGGTLALSVLGPPVDLNQTITDGQNGFDFFVRNDNGDPGADPSRTVGIQILNGGPNGGLIASSVGNGAPQAGGPVAYPISDPTSDNFAPPPAPGPGFLAYNGGTATGPIGNGDGWVLDFGHTFTPITGTIPVPSGGVAVRRFKLSENNSPLPRDRFIFNYNYFDNVIGGIGNVNRYAFGFERTFHEGSSSIQVLFPFASTLAADQVTNGLIAKNTQFGDIPIIFKTILAERDEYVLTAGLGVTVPTGSDARVFNTQGNEIIHVNHASVHMLPYLALLRAYDSGWYWQSFLQLDIDTNGNKVQADLQGVNLQPVGVLQEQTLLFADLGVGYQFTQLDDDNPIAVAATAELHYASPLQDSDSIMAGALDLRGLTNRFDVVNLTLGMNFLTSSNFAIRPAMVIPLSDDQFDYEAMVQMNYFR